MFNGDWFKRYSTALIAVAILAVLGLGGTASFKYGSERQAEYERYADNRRREYTANTYSPERQRCFRLAAGFQHDCVTEAKEEYDDYHREQQDLVAQRVTALWTKLMGGAAIAGMVLSAFGVFLIWTTFNATKEANEIARDTAMQQLRAYLHPNSPFLNGLVVGAFVTAKINIKNYGPTPANDVMSVINYFLTTADFEYSSEVPDMGIAVSRAPLPPGEDLNIEVKSPAPLTAAEREALLRSDCVIFVMGKVTYYDAFLKPRETTFRFRTSAKTSNALTVCAMGNKAT